MSGIFKRSAIGLAVLLLVAGCTSNQSSQNAANTAMAPRSFTAWLTAGQEVPPNLSLGNGTASVTLDPNGMLHWTVSYQGLSGPATAAHFHGPATPGFNAGVVVPISGPSPASPMQGSAQLTPAQISDLVAGRWYVNVHTAANPGGEIRGQVVPAL